MHPESNLNHAKDQAAKQYAAQGSLHGAGTTESALRARLRSDCNNLADQHGRSARALEILQRHPEFELFIELLGLIRVDIRFTPIQAEKALVTE